MLGMIICPPFNKYKKYSIILHYIHICWLKYEFHQRVLFWVTESIQGIAEDTWSKTEMKNIDEIAPFAYTALFLCRIL